MSKSRLSADFRRTPFGQLILDHGRRDRAVREGRKVAMASPMFEGWTDGVFPPLAKDAERFVSDDGVRLHGHAAAVNSSMVFGFNLFLPFRVDGPEPLASLLSTVTRLELRIERIQFEYGPSEILAETQSDPPRLDEPRTTSDVGIEVRDAAGRHGIVLIEVKLSEGGFTTCGGRGSPRNGRRDVCDSAAVFFAETGACYLNRPAHARRDRRYWSIFAAADGTVQGAFPGADLGGCCPFADDMQQPMRNHALALGLLQSGRYEFARFGLVHHDDNPDVPLHWERYRAMIADPEVLFRLPASAVIEAGRRLEASWSSDWAQYLEDRYRLGVGGDNERRLQGSSRRAGRPFGPSH
jgi:hypothetical protein